MYIVAQSCGNILFLSKQFCFTYTMCEGTCNYIIHYFLYTCTCILVHVQCKYEKNVWEVVSEVHHPHMYSLTSPKYNRRLAWPRSQAVPPFTPQVHVCIWLGQRSYMSRKRESLTTLWLVGLHCSTHHSHV